MRRRIALGAGLVGVAAMIAVASTGGGSLLFNAAFRLPLQGPDAFSDYEYVPGSQYITVVNDPAGVKDPATGQVRHVLKLSVPNSAGGGQDTGARAQLETKPMLQDNGEYYIGHSIYLPSNFPTYGATGYQHVISGAFGSSPTGNSPLRLNFQNRTTGVGELRYQRGSAYGYEIAWRYPTAISGLRGHWIDIVDHVKFSTDPKVGFREIYVNEGKGWVKTHFEPTTQYHTTSADGTRIYLKTSDPATDGVAPFDHRINNYYTYGSYTPQGIETVTMYQGPHRIATSFDLANPHSYN
jgi:Polysaccharide lyase